MTRGACRAWATAAALWCAVLAAYGAPPIQAPGGRAMLAVASDGRTWLASGDGVLRFDADAGGALRPTAVFRWPAPSAHAAWTVAGVALDRTGAPGVAVEHLADTRDLVAARRVATVWLDPAVPAGRTLRVVPVQLPGKVMLAGDAAVAAADDGTLLVALHSDEGDDRLVRVDRHGRPDAAFGRRARLSLLPGLVTGVVPSTQGPGSYMLGEADFDQDRDGVVLRLRADGSRDETFARDGVLRFLRQRRQDGWTSRGVPEALLEDRTGALWTAGRASVRERIGDRDGWWIERFTLDGRRDLEWARQAEAGGGAEAWRAAGSNQVGVRVGLMQGGASGGARVCTWPAITHGALRCAALQSGTALAAPRVVLDRVQVLAVAAGPGEMLTVALADDAGRLLLRRVAFP